MSNLVARKKKVQINGRNQKLNVDLQDHNRMMMIKLKSKKMIKLN
jgi:hypothetical protein